MSDRVITSEQIERELKLASSMMRDLDDIKGVWTELSDDEYADWLVEWEDFMNAIRYTLDAAYRSGQMIAGQELVYRELLLDIKRHILLIEELELTVPKVSLEI